MTECGYCGNEELAYELQSDRGQVSRCIPCLAIEQGQQSVRMPLDSYDGLDDELLERSYESAQDWFRILARITSDDPILKRDPDDYGAVGESTRTFLTNIMGSDAHYPPSEIVGSEVAVAQTTLGEAGDDS